MPLKLSLPQRSWAWIIIIANALYWAFLLNYGITHAFPSYYSVVVATVIGLSIASLGISAGFRVNVALLIVSMGLAFLVGEMFLEITDSVKPKRTRYSIAESLDLPFDSRTRIQVVKDLRAEGVDAFPGGFPSIFQPELQGDDVVPIGFVSDKPTVYCNESGERVIYRSDEHGFNNPKGIWGQDTIAIVALGDSFVIGACVKSEENAISHIRNVQPRTLNLGSPGSGPWGQYAVFKEYVLELKPNVVLWFYFEGNDILDFEDYENLSLLKRYVDTDFRQQLMTRQTEIDLAMTIRTIRILDDEATTKETFPTIKSLARSVSATASLQQIRVRLRNLIKDCDYQVDEEESARFERMLSKSNDYVRSWGGTLYFIYLPTATRYLEADTCWLKEQVSFINYHDQIVTLAESAGLSVIDIPEAFDAHPDPLSLFPFRVYGHYNPEGYKLVADTILESIQLPE